MSTQSIPELPGLSWTEGNTITALVSADDGDRVGKRKRVSGKTT